MAHTVTAIVQLAQLGLRRKHKWRSKNASLVSMHGLFTVGNSLKPMFIEGQALDSAKVAAR